MTTDLRIASFEDACRVAGFTPGDPDGVGLVGRGWYELRDEDGDLKELGVFANLITDVGDSYYAKRASGISSPPGQVTGMRLGTGSTAVAKNGAGAALVTYAGTGITASRAIDSTWPQGSQTAGAGYQVQWKTSWAAGEVTVNGLAEVVVTNDASNGGSFADGAGSAADTIARALLSPVVNKAALDTLAVTWNHVLLGA